jgi:hypothetical protein
MTYTLWSRGRLLGESELDYVRVFRRHRTGDFYPTDVGAKLMPVATGVSPAGINLAGMIAGTSEGAKVGSLEEKVRQTSEWADLAAAQNHSDALALELRGPDGSVILTEWIDVRDTEFLLSLARDDELEMTEGDGVSWDDVEEEYDGDFDVDYGSEEPFPRYQLQVMLRDDAAVP